MKLCAKAFLDTPLSINSGYEFYFPEPLIDLNFDLSVNPIFDLFLYNAKEKRIILIECKSSIGLRPKFPSQIKKAKEFLEKNIGHLSEIIGSKLDVKKIEYVLCVYSRDKDRVIDSINSHSNNKSKNNDNDLFKLWYFMPKNQELRLYDEHTHQNKILSDSLKKGFSFNEYRNQLELPFYLNMHNFKVINNIVLGYCYNFNRRDESIEDPKIIRYNQIYKTIEENVSFGLLKDDEITKTKLISQKISQVINYGKKYDLFDVDEKNNIKLKCYGKELKVVIANIEEKFISNWANLEAEESAKKNAFEDYKLKISKKYPTLDSFSSNAEKTP
ncbi:MAG: hypothetical protein Q7U51_11425 [Methanoregula sp.]|nr:hypothetical protein [Methanoregula sp.]